MKKFLSNLLVKILVPRSLVLSNQKIGENFQLLTIKLPKKKEWIPGQKIQIKVTDKEMRSYTPLHFEKDQKTFQTLIYNLRQGPGALWSEAVTPQTKVQVVGPRPSLDIREVKTNVFFFGDETTFGLAYALIKNNLTTSIKCFFEGNDFKDSDIALKSLELDKHTFFERTQNEEHLKKCAEEILSQHTNEMIVLSGKKSSISYLKNFLEERGVSPELIMKKKYWGWKKPASAV